MLRSETEVRKFRDNLRSCAETKCDCDSNMRHLVCLAMRQDLMRQVRLLTWVLGESWDLDGATEEAAAMAAGQR